MHVATADGLGSALAALGGKDDAGNARPSTRSTALPALRDPQRAHRSGPVRPALRGRLHARLAAARVRLLHRKLRRRAGARRGHGAAGVPHVDARAATGGSRAACRRAARLAQWDGGGRGQHDGHRRLLGLRVAHRPGRERRASATTKGSRSHRLVAAVDCGRVVNSGLAAQQIEAGLIWALAQATVPAPEWVAGMPRARPIGGIGLPRIGDTPANRRPVHPEQRRAGRPQRPWHHRRSPPPSPMRSTPASGKRMRALPFDPMAAHDRAC